MIAGPERGEDRHALPVAALGYSLIGINAHPRRVWQRRERAHVIAPEYGAVLQPADRFNCHDVTRPVRFRAIAPRRAAAHPDCIETIREAPGA